MTVFEISYYVLIGVLGTMALVLFVLPIRKDVRLEGYNVSLKLMALSFLALSLYCTFKWAIPQEMFNLYFLFMAHLQANLLGLGHINLLTPKKVTKSYVFGHFVPLILCLLVYGVICALFPRVHITEYALLQDKSSMLQPEWLIRCAWMLVYAGSTIYYAVVFFHEYKQYEKLADNYYVESTRKSTRIIYISFIFALLTATTTLFITISLSPILSAVLNMCILVLYSMMGIFYIQYPMIFPTLEPVLYENPEDESSDDQSSDEVLWQVVRARIMDERLYLRSGLTMEDLSQELKVARNRMSAMINRYEHVNFNTFINRLRVEAACEMLESNPTLRASALWEKLGYSEQSNFARNFKQHTGKTPKEYAKSLLK